MSNAITIKRIQLSLIWTEALPELLLTPSRALPMGFLGQRQYYAVEFERALTRTAWVAPPWMPQSRANRNHFWFYYLGRKMPDALSGDDAWRNVVPLRASPPVRIRMPDFPASKILDAFFYPHGMAFAYTVILEPAQSLADTVNMLVRARREHAYEVKWENKPARRMTLDAIAETALDAMRVQIFGASLRRDTPRGEPFTIATVTAGTLERAKPPQPVINRDAVHQALHALCSFSPTWEQESTGLPDLRTSSASVKLMPDDHVLYGVGRHRVVWFPVHFTATASKRHTLGCYHRNLVMLSVQTEMLGKLAQMFAQQIEQNILVAPALFNLVENGASILSRLRGGKTDTYQSWSARKQIEDPDVLAALKKTRQYLGWDVPRAPAKTVRADNT